MLKRVAIWGAVLVGLLVAGGFLAWRLWRGPDPAEILARTPVPPAPVLTPEQELATFRLASGFRVELVAAEPLVVDPVAMDWDDRGRLYVVEMRGFMRDLDGGGEEEPSGRVVLLEDTDGDGLMDTSGVFLDALVMPRAVAVLPEGVLVGVPPDLWLCRDPGGEDVCSEKIRLTHYALGRHDPEHLENGLLPGIDGWIYNAKSSRRFRLRGTALEIESTPMRGQWGIAQDDEGRLFYNHNSAFLFGDVIPGEYAMQQAGTATSPTLRGVGLPLADGAEVFGVRVAPGLNRAYLHGTLRADGRQHAPTGVSGLAIQRGDQYGEPFAGDAFMPEVAGNAVAHFAVDGDGLDLQAEHRLYADPNFGEREFLASTDERFRPVDAKVGPDGTIWVIDMYRGLIQHANYVSDHLRDYVQEHELEAPGATGRIWRIVREELPLSHRPPPLGSLDDQLRALDHPNGWVRDRAQRRLMFEASPEASPRLRRLEDFGELGRIHALHALAGLGQLDGATFTRALADPDPRVRRAALRAGEKRVAQADPDLALLRAVEALLEDEDPGVRVQALHSLGTLPVARRPLARLLAEGRRGGPIERQAVISGLGGLELGALESELAEGDEEGDGESSGPDSEWLQELATAAFLGARARDDRDEATRRMLDRIAELGADPRAEALFAGIQQAQRRPGSRIVELAERHSLFDPGRDEGGELAGPIAGVKAHFTWPGDPRPGGARALTPAESERRERGRELYRATCAACHGPDGRGQSGLAPPLAGSPWVRDTDDWLVRIALGGLTGRIVVDGQEWNLTMPGHGHDERFDDEGVAGLGTFLRRAWGHAEEPVAPESVVRIRRETTDRRTPWTERELLALPVDHRLDRYTGLYRVPIVGIEIEIGRRGTELTIGRPNGPSGPLADIGGGAFMAEGVSIHFESDETGEVDGATLYRDGTPIGLSKEE
jgi:mono/diheme cytochrome c family protein/glucose/arabinose dehydrogenase